MPKNIILDMGNVLLDYNPEVPLKMFCSSDEERDIIRRELFEGPEWLMGDKGTIKDAERYDLVKERVPNKYWDALKKCCNEWDVCMKPLPGAENFCRYAKHKGLGLYVLSNASDLFYTYFERFMPMDFFDGIVVSSDVHMLKPDRRIFEYILEKYGLDAGECLFVDDKAYNVDAAISVGMQAHLFDGEYVSLLAIIG